MGDPPAASPREQGGLEPELEPEPEPEPGPEPALRERRWGPRRLLLLLQTPFKQRLRGRQVVPRWGARGKQRFSGQKQITLSAALACGRLGMSGKLQSRPAEHGEDPRRRVANGTGGPAAPVLSTYTPEEMVQQMKELITENNELKGERQHQPNPTGASIDVNQCLISDYDLEAMKLHNQAMKDRYEELSVWREKQREEREFYESKFKEAKQCLLAKCMENEQLQKELQSLKAREEGDEMEGSLTPEKAARQLKSQVLRLQAEKADLLAIISELQVKLNNAAEDSFVEIAMH
ncbi:PREDICTED: optineurin-like, partial [Tinamus guttatus]|uniref:optineurin-like n=1 Tax=Tinamus guttatus TaxID=94827 RepID=UPI00052EE034